MSYHESEQRRILYEQHYKHNALGTIPAGTEGFGLWMDKPLTVEQLSTRHISWLDEVAERYKDDNVLRYIDLASGNGAVSLAMAEYLARKHHAVHAVLVDLLPDGIHQSQQFFRKIETSHNLTVDHIVGDIRQLPIGDGAAQAISCRMGLHWLNGFDIRKSLKEAERVLTDKGVFCVDVCSIYNFESIGFQNDAALERALNVKDDMSQLPWQVYNPRFLRNMYFFTPDFLGQIITESGMKVTSIQESRNAAFSNGYENFPETIAAIAEK